MTRPIQQSAWRYVCAALFGASVIACSARPAEPARTPPASTELALPDTPLHEGPLTDYVPAAGLRWMVVGKPRALLANTALRGRLERLFPKERLASFTEATGIDLAETESALVAGFDFGTLYLLSHRGDVQRIQEAFSARFDKPTPHKRTHARIVRSQGTVQGRPRGFIGIRDQLVGFALDDPTPVRVVEAYARERLKSAPALRGAALSSFAGEEAGNVLFFAPGPFDNEWQGGVAGILARTTAVRIALRQVEAEQATLQVAFAGAWRTDPEARGRLLEGWAEVANSGLGRLLGLDQPLTDPRVEVASEHLSLEVSVALAPIVLGLHHAVQADAWEILNRPRPADSEPAPDREPGAGRINAAP
jgi:hypothetical protein